MRMLSSCVMSSWRKLKSFVSEIDRRAAAALIAGLALAFAVLWLFLDAVTSLPDFRQYEAGPERKAVFFAYMRPLIREENDRIREDRARLLAIAAKDGPGWSDRRWLARLADDYGLVDEAVDDPALIQRLLRRVDIVPMSLALAQAAKESGWGSSRFAREGNNLFGEWCFDDGCGLVPRSRARGATHEVETFFTPRNSVRSYLENINTHEKYQGFRRERERMRAQGRPLSGLTLADELSQYSERREAYVKELKALIATNDLEEGREGDSD